MSECNKGSMPIAQWVALRYVTRLAFETGRKLCVEGNGVTWKDTLLGNELDEVFWCVAEEMEREVERTVSAARGAVSNAEMGDGRRFININVNFRDALHRVTMMREFPHVDVWEGEADDE